MKNNKKYKCSRKLVLIRSHSYKNRVGVAKRFRVDEDVDSDDMDSDDLNSGVDYPDLDDDKTIDEIIEDMIEIENNPDAFNW